ncbi:hypothetical protein SISSUDRAFT_344003 [Sistotremastrum suecicum HHB10207 ss-3]|uniref:Uncharacterized protein n=1 Tax=Sistotremastrum suecicum HHB10207 ss-3 TaxID=1314776 RepID=A0A166IZV6_9AGAM|nr:hypothetical protein SISSUDRAFT_344003 [Sistotremastrum suecicum HHB10207 ss-3]
MSLFHSGFIFHPYHIFRCSFHSSTFSSLTITLVLRFPFLRFVSRFLTLLLSLSPCQRGPFCPCLALALYYHYCTSTIPKSHVISSDVLMTPLLSSRQVTIPLMTLSLSLHCLGLARSFLSAHGHCPPAALNVL